MKIAVVGSGITGMSAAWALRDVHDVTLFEKADKLGGHSNTVCIDYDGTKIDVDTGFIVYNALNYPNLIALFEALKVETGCAPDQRLGIDSDSQNSGRC